MMIICIQQRLSNIWSSVHVKVKQHWGRVGKEKSMYSFEFCHFYSNSSRSFPKFSRCNFVVQFLKSSIIWECRWLFIFQCYYNTFFSNCNELLTCDECSYWHYSYRSSHRRCSARKGVLRNLAKFTGKHLCQSLFFNKVSGLKVWNMFKVNNKDTMFLLLTLNIFHTLRPATLWKKRLWHRCFPVNFAKYLRTPFS